MTETEYRREARKIQEWYDKTIKELKAEKDKREEKLKQRNWDELSEEEKEWYRNLWVYVTKEEFDKLEKENKLDFENHIYAIKDE